MTEEINDKNKLYFILIPSNNVTLVRLCTYAAVNKALTH